MQIALVVPNIKDTLGIGNRLIIYVAGCPFRCLGCETPELRETNPKFEIDYNSFIIYITSFDLCSFDGVTISGGEPFLNRSDLLKIVKYLSLYFDDICIYTGYKLEDLNDEICKQIFSYISVLIDGNYEQELDRGEKLKGSSNQKFYFFKEKYKNAYLTLNKEKRKMVEVIDLNVRVGLKGGA